MPLVDINALAGRPLADAVTEAWVMDRRATSPDAARSTQEAVDPRIKDYLVAMPGSLAELERRATAYRARGMPAVVRICPGPEGHGYPLADWALGGIPEYCAREELALVIDLPARENVYPWVEIVTLARAHPRLAVVALAAPFGGPTAGMALDATANLIVEMSRTRPREASVLADLVATRGAYRFVFGTGPAGADRSVASELGEADADMVLSGTAAHLAAGTWSTTYL